MACKKPTNKGTKKPSDGGCKKGCGDSKKEPMKKK
jgi:hypothetical protein